MPGSINHKQQRGKWKRELESVYNRKISKCFSKNVTKFKEKRRERERNKFGRTYPTNSIDINICFFFCNLLVFFCLLWTESHSVHIWRDFFFRERNCCANVVEKLDLSYFRIEFEWSSFIGLRVNSKQETEVRHFARAWFE